MAKKILIAEDDFFIRDIYTRTFSVSGFEVDVAVDGLEAIEKIKAKPYDIILLDIMMPKMTGIEVLREIRSLDSPVKDTPVFIGTNIAQQDLIDEAFKLGMDGYIIKAQVTPQQIVSELNTFLAGKEQEKTSGQS